MKLRTVIIALSVFFISTIVIWSIWEVNSHKIPSQIQFLNTILNSKMDSGDNSNWKAEEGGIYYQSFNAKGEETGYSRMVVTINVNKATDLSNILKIAAHYFPEKADEIYGVVLAKNDRFKSKKIDIVDYEFTDQDKKVTVRAFNVNKEQYVSMEIILPS